MIELSFAQALEEPNKEFSFKFSIPLDNLEDAFLPNKIVDVASVSLIYFVDYDSYLHLKGNIRVPCRFVCDRCGAGFEKNLFLEIDEKIAPEMSEEDDLSYDLPVIELDDIIESFVLMNFPRKILCTEDCKGLCPICGANLNQTDCGHGNN